MALITRFEESPGADVAFRTEVECGWRVGQVDRRRILHLETYGSAERRRQGKVSQVIDLDERAARELVGILRKAFPGIP